MQQLHVQFACSMLGVEFLITAVQSLLANKPVQLVGKRCCQQATCFVWQVAATAMLAEAPAGGRWVLHSAADRCGCLTWLAVPLVLHSQHVVRQGCAGWSHHRVSACVVICASISLWFYVVIITLSFQLSHLFCTCTGSALYIRQDLGLSHITAACQVFNVSPVSWPVSCCAWSGLATEKWVAVLC